LNKFKTLKHTADITVRVYGNNPDEILLNSISTLAILFFKNNKKGDAVHKTLKLPERVNPSLIISILNMIISDLETDGILYYEGNKSNLTLDLNGFKPSENLKKRNEIKAATFHNIPDNFVGSHLDITFDL
jgi:SHS2 domain-containing protein